jgi:hypothetical protein
MFARHGGTTEAQQAGVNLADIAEHAQHADINTTRKHYIVPSVETSRRGGETACRASPGKEEEDTVKLAFRTEFRTGALSAWYSWVDSNHRPPDPQSVSSY